MTIFNKFSKIKQFRDVVKEVQQHCKHHNTVPPVLKFTGTVKLHGTNAGIGYRFDTDFLWAQSRERVITPDDDNAGFARFVEDNKEFFKDFCAHLCAQYRTMEVMLFGEWAGGNIQSGVALSQLPKQFYIFAAKAFKSTYVDGNGDIVKVWETCETTRGNYNDREVEGIPFKAIWDINFPVYEVEIDFSKPSAIQNKLVELTMAVEEQCPVAAAQGAIGIGEGIVWTYEDADFGELMFKVKGEKHSVSKVKTVAVLSDEDLARIGKATDAVDTFATFARLDQGISKLGEMGLDITMKNIGTYIKWVCTDINEEEGDIIDAAMLDRKMLMHGVTAKAKAFYMAHANKV